MKYKREVLSILHISSISICFIIILLGIFLKNIINIMIGLLLFTIPAIISKLMDKIPTVLIEQKIINQKYITTLNKIKKNLKKYKINYVYSNNEINLKEYINQEHAILEYFVLIEGEKSKESLNLLNEYIDKRGLQYLNGITGFNSKGVRFIFVIFAKKNNIRYNEFESYNMYSKNYYCKHYYPYSPISFTFQPIFLPIIVLQDENKVVIPSFEYRYQSELKEYERIESLIIDNKNK